MARPALRIDVTSKDRKRLRELLRGGVQQVRVVLRAVALSQLAQGVSAPRISSVIPLTPQAIRKVGHRYQQGGLDRALYEKERPGAAEVLEDSQKQRIIAEIGIFSRQCLGTRRIPDLETLRREARAWNRRMNRDRIQINWKFDRQAARRKFGYKRKPSRRSET